MDSQSLLLDIKNLLIDIKGILYFHTLMFNQIIGNEANTKKQFKHIMTDLTELTAAVEKDTEVDQAAITLLNGLKAKLDEAGTDPVALKALSEQLGSNAQNLADAIVANTPAA